MKILALDVATRCGFAHSCGISGTWDLSPRKDESKGMRLIRLRGKLNEMHKTEPFELVVFESAVSYGAKHAKGIAVQTEMQGVLKLWCEDNAIEYKGYPPSEIKKHATGKGNAKKDMMLAAAKAKWTDRNISDDNEADALHLLDLVVNTI